MGKILVVEDDLVTQKLVSAMLEKKGHSTFVSPNGRHAMESLQVNYFDLIITDVMMPELDGRELIEAIRKYPRLSNMPVIIISAVIRASDVMELLKHGATYFIPKPLSKEQVLEYVDLSLEELRQKKARQAKTTKEEIRTG